MAGDWIPMRTDLLEDPAVIAIASATGLDEFGVVGRLHKLWSWANKHLADGNARSVTSQWVDRYLSTPGFAAAMLHAGWLRDRTGGIEFPHFERWNSQGAKRRVLTAQRVKGHRNRGNAEGNAPRNAPSVTEALPEKRREETKDSIAPAGPKPVEVKTDPAPKPKPAPKPRPRNPLFDAIADVTGADPTVNGSHIGKVGAVFAAADPPYTPDEVREFAATWRELLPWAKPAEHPRLTLGILEKHLPQLRASKRAEPAPKPRVNIITLPWQNELAPMET